MELQYIPQEGQRCGTRGQISFLVDLFPGSEDEQEKQAEFQKDGEGTF